MHKGDSVKSLEVIEMPKKEKAKEKVVVTISEHKLFNYSEQLKKKFSFATMKDTKDIYIYDEVTGVYISEGDIRIEQECQKDLKHLASGNSIGYVKGQIARDTYKTREEFDAKPNLICVKNGILDLDTLDFRNEHDPSILFLRYIPVIYSPEETCPLFESALERTFSERDKRLFVQYLGYTLIPKNIYRMACMVVGKRRTGKGKIVEAFRRMLGKEWTSSLTIQDLDTTFLPAYLQGKTANIRSEISSKDMKSVQRFNSLVCTDIITVQEKNKPPYNLENKAKFFFTSNSLPTPPEEDRQAYFDRLMILVATYDYKSPEHKSVDDEDIDYKLASEEELSGMLNLAIRGYKELRKNHGFNPAQTEEEVARLYYGWSGDFVSRFISQYLEQQLGTATLKDFIYDKFAMFCLSEGKSIDSRETFWRSMRTKISYDEKQISASQNPARPWTIIGWRLKK